VFQNSDRKSVPVKGTQNADAPGTSPRHYGAPVAMALYNQGSDVPVIPINRMCPRSQKGQGWLKGGRGAFNKRRN